MPMSAERRPSPDYLTVPQVAKILGVSRRTVQNWVNDGKLPADLLGTSSDFFIPTEALVSVLTFREGALAVRRLLEKRNLNPDEVCKP